MMTTTGKKLQVLEVVRDGTPVAVLDQHKFMFTLDGQSYAIRTSGLLGRSYELRRGDEVVSSARGETLAARTTITFGDKAWVLKEERSSRFGLFEGDTRLGGFTPGSWLRNWSGATIDLPDTVPLIVQLFLTSIVVSRWREGGGPY